LDSDHPFFAAGVDFTVLIDVYNAGDGAAYDVTIEDDKWPDSFKLTSGERTARFAEIPAKDKQSFNYTLTAPVPGELEPARATVSYQYQLDVPTYQYGLSTGQGNISIIDAYTYSRLTSQHKVEWAVFWVIIGIAVLIPFVLWLQIQVNFQHGLPKDKKRK